jgi:hypothetical protein
VAGVKASAGELKRGRRLQILRSASGCADASYGLADLSLRMTSEGAVRMASFVAEHWALGTGHWALNLERTKVAAPRSR